MKILVGCEESQAVTVELRKLGHEAYSCDIQECSGGHPEWHIRSDVFEAIEKQRWDMGIFFPECTYLTVSANKWYKDQPARKNGTLVGAARRQAREKAIGFFMRLYHCKIPKVAIENPIGVMSSRFRKPDQVIQPWMFGDPTPKSTCLWLRGVPKLKPTDVVEPEFIIGKKDGKKYSYIHHTSVSMAKNERSKLRSKTFPGIAKAMAEQWTTMEIILGDLY